MTTVCLPMHADNWQPLLLFVLQGDLKPGNVLIKLVQGAPYGRVAKVADFGLSRALNAGQSHRSTRTFGTLNHAPPELLRLGRLSPAGEAACVLPLVPGFTLFIQLELSVNETSWSGRLAMETAAISLLLTMPNMCVLLQLTCMHLGSWRGSASLASWRLKVGGRAVVRPALAGAPWGTHRGLRQQYMLQPAVAMHFSRQ
jgi:serine/threonine protein kinase